MSFHSISVVEISSYVYEGQVEYLKNDHLGNGFFSEKNTRFNILYNKMHHNTKKHLQAP